MIFDTDVLIWFFRGNEKAIESVEKFMPFSVSIVTYMELLQGMRNKQETAKMKKAFKAMNVNVIPINEIISFQAAQYVENYSLSDFYFYISVTILDSVVVSFAGDN